jgi:hypothetical protein
MSPRACQDAHGSKDGEPVMLTVQEAAELLQISTQTVRVHCRQTDGFPAVNVGVSPRYSIWRINRAQLIEWMRHRAQDSSGSMEE